MSDNLSKPGYEHCVSAWKKDVFTLVASKNHTRATPPPHPSKTKCQLRTKFVLHDAKNDHRLSNANSSDVRISSLWRLLSSKLKTRTAIKKSLVQYSVINQCKLNTLLIAGQSDDSEKPD